MIFNPGMPGTRLKWAFESCRNGAWGSEPDGENDVVCIRAADFDGQSGRLNAGERTLRSVDKTAFDKISLQPGDLVMEKSGGGEKQLVGRTALFDDDRPSVTSNFLARCRPAEEVDPAFLNYLMLAIYVGRGTYPHIKQSTGIQNLDLGSYLDMRVRIPGLTVQQRVVRFLDEKTARIDALIEKKRVLLDRLAEKRQTMITHAVTSGLNPGVQMKPSGVEWLGEIPAHWNVRGLTKCTWRVDYRGATPEKATIGVFLVTAKNIKGGRIDYEASQEFVSEDIYEHAMRRGLPAIGDVLFTTEAPLGEIAQVDRTDIALAQRVIKFSSSTRDLHNDYLAYWMMCSPFQAQIHSRSTGSTAIGLKASKIVDLPCLLPPVDEQIAIANEIKAGLERFREAEAMVERSLDQQIEYRSSLVSAAVTGKLPELNG
ncbi:hypothetical protein [Pseudoxanthomonas japonensis]|uniref:hypothetical protein n=1 Tax=Pseudoxanthomonas japonensis TaxID=69284 RepID=UPI003747E97D